MSDRVAITGANSAVGRAILRAFAVPGSSGAAPLSGLVACVRSERARAALPPLRPGSTSVVAAYADAPALESALDGASAVVHLPGVLIEASGSTYEAVHIDTTRAIVAAAKSNGLGKIVLVSAFGADPSSRNRYYATKGESERIVAQSGIAYTILRAPLILGPGTEGSAALLRYVAGGTARLLGGGHHRVQPLDIRDLAVACLRATAKSAVQNRTLDLLGPEAISYRDLVLRLAAIGGRSVEVKPSPLPVGLVALAAQVRTRLLGPGFSKDAIEVIMDDNLGCADDAARALGLELTPLDDTLRSTLHEDARAGEDGGAT